MSFKPPESEIRRPAEDGVERLPPDHAAGLAHGATPAEYGRRLAYAVFWNFLFMPLGFYYQRNTIRFWIFTAFDVLGKSLLLFFSWAWPQASWGWPHITAILTVVFGFQVYVIVETVRVHRREPMSDALIMRSPHGWWFLPIFIIGLTAGGLLMKPLEKRIMHASNIASSGMAPTLVLGDLIYVDMLTGTRSIRRGDILVFTPPDAPEKSYIKRVVGLPGEHIRLAEESLNHKGKPIRVTRIYINKKPLPLRVLDTPVDDFALDSLKSEPRVMLEEGTKKYKIIEGTLPRFASFYSGIPVDGRVLGPDEFFMMGDNRDDSKDSRYMGPISRKRLLGRYMYTYFSINFHYETCAAVREKLRAGTPKEDIEGRSLCGGTRDGGLMHTLRRYRRASVRWENIRVAN